MESSHLGFRVRVSHKVFGLEKAYFQGILIWRVYSMGVKVQVVFVCRDGARRLMPGEVLT